MIFVYRRKASEGATELAEALGARRYRGKTIPIDVLLESRKRQGRRDTVICWGEELPAIDGVKILNGTPIQNKYRDAVKLKEKGVPTIEVSITRPTATPQPAVDPARQLFDEVKDLAEEFSNLQAFARGPVISAGVTQLHGKVAELRTVLTRPLPPPTPAYAWLGRTNNHVGGNDLLTPTNAPNYFSKKEDLVREFRIHSFLAKSIRAGVKDHREGFTAPVAQATPVANVAHAWIRSWDGGWRIKYDGVTSKQKHRDIAHAAAAALDLQFAAVDIGEKADGSLIVLEVNRAPGIEAGTIDSYAGAIKRWIDGRVNEEV